MIPQSQIRKVIIDFSQLMLSLIDSDELIKHDFHQWIRDIKENYGSMI